MIDLLDRTIEELLRLEFRELREKIAEPGEDAPEPVDSPSVAGQSSAELTDARQAEREFVASLGEITYSFQQPKTGWNTTAQSGAGINLFLYDVRENAQLRRHQWETLTNGQSSDPRFVQQKRLPLRMDCFYLVTAWHDLPPVQHWLLASCLQILGRYPILTQDKLQGRLKEQPYEVRAKLAAHDVMTNPAELWSALGNDLRAGFSYVVTIAIDPWQPISVPIVTIVEKTVTQK
jgi:hypothetical protein